VIFIGRDQTLPCLANFQLSLRDEPAAFGLIKGLDRSKVVDVKLAERVIASHVKKHAPVPRAIPTAGATTPPAK
jgi:hypothetical protein